MQRKTRTLEGDVSTHVRDKPASLQMDLTGEKYGRLLVCGYRKKDKNRQIYWVCLCDCGQIIVAAGRHLRYGSTTSCGCFRRQQTRERRLIHGMTNTPLYRIWRAMLDRCYLESCKGFKYYGGKGITVCRRWRTSFKNFYDDMAVGYESGLWIDRIKNSKGYTPRNCRWVTPKEQQRNRSDNRRLRLNGKVRPLATWVEMYGASYSLVHRRLARDWPLLPALTLPSRSRLSKYKESNS